VDGSDNTFTWRGQLDGDGKPDGHGVLVHEGTGNVHEGRMTHGLRQGQWVATITVAARGMPGSSDAGPVVPSNTGGWTGSGYSYVCTDDVQCDVKVRSLGTAPGTAMAVGWGWGECRACTAPGRCPRAPCSPRTAGPPRARRAGGAVTEARSEKTARNVRKGGKDFRGSWAADRAIPIRPAAAAPAPPPS
jgi:hypothetical protein